MGKNYFVQQHIKNFFLFLSLLIICNPYIKYFKIGTNSDTQLYPLLLSFFISIIFIAHEKKIQKLYLYYFSLIIVISLIFILMFGFNYYYLFRGLYGFISIGVISIAVYFLIKYSTFTIFEKYIKIIFYIWVLIGIIQLFIPDSFLFWRDKLIIVGGRGSISLATEPAYFSFALILMSFTLYILNNNNKTFFYISFLVSLFIAKSSVGVIYLGAIIFLLNIKNIKLILLGSVMILIFSFILENYLAGTRLGYVLIEFLSNPFQLVLLDQSLGLRHANVVIPYLALIENNFLPHGFYQWGYYQYNALFSYYSDAIWIKNIVYSESNSGRALSIHGRLWFEMGFLSIFFYYYFYSLVKINKNKFFILISFFILFFNGLSLANPFFSLFLGTLLFTRFNQIKEKKCLTT